MNIEELDITNLNVTQLLDLFQTIENVQEAVRIYYGV